MTERLHFTRPREIVASNVAMLLQESTKEWVPLSVRYAASEAALAVLDAWMASAVDSVHELVP